MPIKDLILQGYHAQTPTMPPSKDVTVGSFKPGRAEGSLEETSYRHLCKL
jgi:hypothetical protein